MLNATVDTNDMLGQVVNRFTNSNHKHLCHSRNVKIQRYISFCKIVNSAEQSKHRLLVRYINNIILFPITLLANSNYEGERLL
jgi:hypothetical protein